MVKQFQSLMRRLKDERGMALLATMLAIALMTIIVVDFTSSSAMGYLSAANHANEIRAEYLARSAINVGLALIAQDSRQQQTQQTANGSGGISAQNQPADSFMSVWALPFPPMPVNGGTVQLSVVDEARKFDINRLVVGTLPTTGTTPTATGTTSSTTTSDQDQNQDSTTAGQGSQSVGQATANGTQLAPGQIDPNAVAQLQRLFLLLNIPIEIIPAIVDWLDKDSIESQGGAEADYYLRLIPPYEPRNGPMPTLGDLRLVKGIDDAMFMKLRNYLTVAPEPAVNVNTAPPEVIACMEQALMSNPGIIQNIIQARSTRPFTAITDVLNLVGTSVPQNNLTQDLTTRGQYFTITGMGAFAGTRKLVFATFHRNGDGTAALGSWQED
jgi:general secretion pathway protein K